MYDVIVVGAGPAGALLAYLLAGKGLRTLLLDKAELPRYKPCGGGLPYKTVKSIPFAIDPVLEVQAEGGVVTYQGRQYLKTAFERPFGWLVMRDRFDHFLVEQAVTAGAELISGRGVDAVEQDATGVTAITGGENFRASLLVGADGVNSIVARSSGIMPNRQTGVAIEAEVAVPEQALREQGAYVTFDFSALPRGYGWIFPKSDHLSVGIFRSAPGKVQDIRQKLEFFMDSMPVLRERRMIGGRGHLIPLGGKNNRLHKGRILLVGDAANLADAWIGEGIYYALQSARIAGEEILQTVDKGKTCLENYTNRIQSTISRQLRAAQFFGNLVYWKPRTATTLLSRSKRLQGVLFSAIRGDLSIPTFTRLLWLQAPLIILEALLKGEKENEGK